MEEPKSGMCEVQVRRCDGSRVERGVMGGKWVFQKDHQLDR